MSQLEDMIPSVTSVNEDSTANVQAKQEQTTPTVVSAASSFGIIEQFEKIRPFMASPISDRLSTLLDGIKAVHIDGKSVTLTHKEDDFVWSSIVEETPTRYVTLKEALGPEVLAEMEREIRTREEPEPVLPVVSIDGPVVYGDVNLIGTRVIVLALWGCDYRCIWCNRIEAVLPEYHKHITQMSVSQIAHLVTVQAHNNNTEWVIITGGNPTLYNLEDLIRKLHNNNLKVCVETQGSIVAGWLAACDNVVVSPSSPSSQMSLHTKKSILRELLETLELNGTPHVLKVLIDDRADFIYATLLHQSFPKVDMYLSVCNTDFTDYPTGSYKERLHKCSILQKLKEITEWNLNTIGMENVKVLAPLDTLLYGNRPMLIEDELEFEKEPTE